MFSLTCSLTKCVYPGSQVRDEAGVVLLNQTADAPHFSVPTLTPGKTFSIRIRAFNPRGFSQAVRLSASTLKVAEKRMGALASGMFVREIYEWKKRNICGRKCMIFHILFFRSKKIQFTVALHPLHPRFLYWKLRIENGVNRLILSLLMLSSSI